jgi:hypothetical protein
MATAVFEDSTNTWYISFAVAKESFRIEGLKGLIS